MLPEPTLTLTIPSIHDGTLLDCRIYHPQSLGLKPGSPPWRKHAAVMAHPYAPMGGCYDDPVVGTVAARLLRSGFLVGTFNFRGAGHSSGHTSWTARPEADDFASFVAFVTYYCHYLDPFSSEDVKLDAASPAQDEVQDDTHDNRDSRGPRFLLGGYSYGSMIVSQAPSLEEILSSFVTPAAGSHAAQIRLQAESLAEKQNVILGSARVAAKEHHQRESSLKMGLRVGGSEGGGSPRKSHDSTGRRSLSVDIEEKLRKGAEELKAIARPSHHTGKNVRSLPRLDELPQSSPAGGKLPPVTDLRMPRPAYLLVSPLQGLVAHLATMSFYPSVLARQSYSHDDIGAPALARHPTLAVFGDGDIFVSASRLREWAKRLSDAPQSRFRYAEITDAGHFWTEEGVLYHMRDLVREFASFLLASS